jgi:hypothetical protein
MTHNTPPASSRKGTRTRVGEEGNPELDEAVEGWVAATREARGTQSLQRDEPPGKHTCTSDRPRSRTWATQKRHATKKKAQVLGGEHELEKKVHLWRLTGATFLFCAPVFFLKKIYAEG